jgi:hypothetical protein
MASISILVNATIKTLEVQLGVKCSAQKYMTGKHATMLDLKELLTPGFKKFLKQTNSELKFAVFGSKETPNPLLLKTGYYLVYNMNELVDRYTKSFHVSLHEYYNLNYSFE